MKTLGPMERLRIWIAAWLLLGMGIAMASPIVQPRAMQLICSGAGAVKFLVQSPSSGTADASDMDCPLCLLPAVAPDPTPARLPTLLPVAKVPVPAASLRIHSSTADPPPARGPPFFSTYLNQERSS
ncbi:MAG: hypothetical protein U1E84_17510 [Rhodoferax sp.]